MKMRVLTATLLLAYSLKAASVSGTVRDGQSLQPLPAVRLVARAGQSDEVLQSAETDSNGRYSLANLPAIEVRVSAAKPGYVLSAATPTGTDITLDLSAGQALSGQDLDLLPGGVVAGRVTDELGEPLAGVQIQVRRTGANNRPTGTLLPVTDDRGVYRVFGLAPGRYILKALRSKPNLAELYYPGKSDEDQAEPIEVRAGSEVEGLDFRFVSTDHVTIKLSEKVAGELHMPSVITNEAQVAAEGAARVSKGGPEGVRSSISGHVFSAQTGEPLKSVSVRVATMVDGKVISQPTSTGPSGEFTILQLDPGEYGVFAEKSGYRPTSLLGQVKLGEKQSRTGVDIRLSRAPVISGRVQDGYGQPVIGASVVAYSLRWRNGRRIAIRGAATTADDRGTYHLLLQTTGRFVVAASLPPRADDSPRGDLDLTAARTFYPSATRASEALPLDVRYGQELSGIDPVLRPEETFSVSGIVADAETHGPCVTCEIQVISLEESLSFSQPVTSVSANGSYRIRGLVPGGIASLRRRTQRTAERLLRKSYRSSIGT
jgi:5-hydroxyisourate hydrolase-like protein (transthyretin family)